VNLVDVRHLFAGYGERMVLKDVSFDVQCHEVLGVLGPNGSGKSTLVRVLSGFLPFDGEVLFEKRSIRELERREVARFVAVVSQSPLRPTMGVWEYLSMGRYAYHGVWDFRLSQRERELVEEMSERFGITHLLYRLLTELSGGEFQLAQIVKALIQQPRFLIMDEPTAHLDIHHQVMILDWLEKIKAEVTVLVVLHDINLAALYCDRILLLKEGGVEVVDAPEKALRYERIEKVFGVPVVVFDDPVAHRPHAYLVPKRILQQNTEEGKNNE
jgi:iron complex transport system ATP-binding protein